jgi:hypothetical protein
MQRQFSELQFGSGNFGTSSMGKVLIAQSHSRTASQSSSVLVDKMPTYSMPQARNALIFSCQLFAGSNLKSSIKFGSVRKTMLDAKNFVNASKQKRRPSLDALAILFEEFYALSPT